MAETILKLTKRQWASVLAVWLLVMWFAISGGGVSLPFLLVFGVVILPVVYFVQLGMVVGGPRLRARFGANQ